MYSSSFSGRTSTQVHWLAAGFDRLVGLAVLSAVLWVVGVSPLGQPVRNFAGVVAHGSAGEARGLGHGLRHGRINVPDFSGLGGAADRIGLPG